MAPALAGGPRPGSWLVTSPCLPAPSVPKINACLQGNQRAFAFEAQVFEIVNRKKLFFLDVTLPKNWYRALLVCLFEIFFQSLDGEGEKGIFSIGLIGVDAHSYRYTLVDIVKRGNFGHRGNFRQFNRKCFVLIFTQIGR